jgi:hypothetical protein
MSSRKLKVAVFAVSIASAAGGNALLTEAPALANAIPHAAPAQSEISHYQPKLRRSVRPDLRRALPEAVGVLPGLRR